MKKFNKLLFFLMDLEKELAQKVVEQANANDEHAVLTNAAHEQVCSILDFGFNVLKEEYAEVKTHKKPKLKLVS